MEFLDNSVHIINQTLVNTLWQGAIICLLLSCTTLLLRKSYAALQYRVWTAGLCLIVVIPIATAAFLNFTPPEENYFVKSIPKGISDNDQGIQPAARLLTENETYAQLESKPGETLKVKNNKQPQNLQKTEKQRITYIPSETENIILSDWHYAASFLWFFLAFVLSGRLIISYIHTRKLKKRAKPLKITNINYDPSILQSVTKRKYRIYVSNDIDSPISLGFFAPAVLIPENILATLNTDELRQILLHESAHLKRYDDWRNLFEKIQEAVFFFNPFIYWINNKVELLREIACDDMVVSKTGNKKEYASTLLKIIKNSGSTPTPILSTGVANSSGHLKHRIKRIVGDDKKHNKRTTLLTLMLVGLLLPAGSVQFTKLVPAFSVIEAEIREVPMSLEHVPSAPVFEDLKSGDITGNTLIKHRYRGTLAQVVQQQSGVQSIHNDKPKWGSEPKVALEFVRKIGGLDVEDENYQLYRPIDVTRDSQGNTYISDQGNSRVQVFDINGNYLKTIGSRGQGPGEFENLLTIHVNKKGELQAKDSTKRKIIVFNTDGKEIRRISLDFWVSELFSDNWFLENGNILLNASSWITADASVKVLDGQGNHIKDFGERKFISSENIEYFPQSTSQAKSNESYKLFHQMTSTRRTQLKKDNTISDMNIDGNKAKITIDDQDDIYVVHIRQNRIEKYTADGELLFTMSRELPYPETKEPVYDDFTFMDTHGRRVTQKRVKWNIFARASGTDDKNRLWVWSFLQQPRQMNNKEFQKSEINAFEIFDTDGMLLGKIPVPDAGLSLVGVRAQPPHMDIAGEPMRVIDDRIYFIDYYNEMAVYEYKIVEK